VTSLENTIKRGSEKIALVNAKEAFAGDLGVCVESALPNWISLRIAPQMASRQRIVEFFRSLLSDLPGDMSEALSLAIHELLGNAIEHGSQLRPENWISLSLVRTARMVMLHLRDGGLGFSLEAASHAAVNNPPGEPLKHAVYRSEKGMRPGGFGILMVRDIADELLYSEHGNEVILIKNIAPRANHS
jgi:anti-sigma regulatory factor (Ser/Thr protein kinase)